MTKNHRGIQKINNNKKKQDRVQLKTISSETIASITRHVDTELFKYTSIESRAKKKKEKSTKTTNKKKNSSELSEEHEHPNHRMDESPKTSMKNQEIIESNMEELNTSNIGEDFEFRGETVFRFEGKNLMYYTNPIKLQEEIDYYINYCDQKIDRAFINNKNKQLYIITSDLQTIKHLEKHIWDKDAFDTGINTVKPKEKAYFIAVRGVPTTVDIKDEDTIHKIKSKYGPIVEFYRITKKSENRELNLIKIKVIDERCANHILSHGLQKGYVNYKTEPWKHKPRPLQCRKCNKFGHITNDCQEKNFTCPLCSQNHQLENCPNRNTQKKIKCSNCQGKHPAFSKICKFMINETNKLLKKDQSEQNNQLGNKKKIPPTIQDNAQNQEKKTFASQAAKQPQQNRPQTCDREYAKGGGVAIIIKNSLKFKILKLSSTDQHELAAIEIFDNHQKIIFISIYVHPNSKTNFDFLENFLTQKKIIITGDFNSQSLDWYCKSSNKRGEILNNLLNQNKICILNDDTPTFRKSSNILDLGLCSNDLTLKYNNPITMTELTNAINQTTTKNSAGYDNISTKTIKNLNQTCLDNILKIFNASFTLGHVPKTWKNAKVIMIHKNKQDPNEPASFRPISLLSCLSKILERILNERLTNWAEKKKILINEQSGFLLFDFEKAFDTIPHANILQKLHKIRCPVLIGNWIRSYLEERTFQIHDEIDSSKKSIEAGIPQGGCLSALLFAIFINDIGKVLKKIGIKFALFADDISVWFSAKSLKKINRMLQKAINKINNFALKWGLKLNVNKTKYMLIANNHNRPSYELSSNLSLEINNQKIEKARQAKLLGINLDPGFKFDTHFTELNKKCSSKLNLLKILSSDHYAIRTKTLITVLKLTIHSIIQYSMLPYHIAQKKVKNKIQIIQNKALKIILKVNRNTSIKILHAIADLPTIEQRLKKLTKNFLTRSAVIDQDVKEIISTYDRATSESTRSILKCLN
ncbi:unnamed protein product [Brachionus calyciflorus]|uniref:Uncharacterized protein n=1 Tax=Brachionus calyciflorus TaxID=104777 RepID=A0A813SK72_9BILA|nr:unnamed protein product [Brachionus calyciflorus]